MKAIFRHLVTYSVTKTTPMVILMFITGIALAQSSIPWKVHSMSRPNPPVVAPAAENGAPPSDAIVLFDGANSSAWAQFSGDPITWKIENGYMEVSEGGSIRTNKGFGDCQLHIEWYCPELSGPTGQNYANSGVYLMGTYEIQVLNSYVNQTYADGQAGALYGQHPPMVNASRPPKNWQTYDIIFTRPRFDAEGGLLAPAYLTVLHNGVLIQNHVALTGPTEWQERPAYKKHADRLPISLQDHGAPVRFRNIWIRDLEQGSRGGPTREPEADYEIQELTAEKRQSYLGDYDGFNIKLVNGGLAFFAGETFKYHIYAIGQDTFVSKLVESRIVFHRNSNGKISGLTMYMGGGVYKRDRK